MKRSDGCCDRFFHIRQYRYIEVGDGHSEKIIQEEATDGLGEEAQYNGSYTA
jgi:hypothetical protein